MLRLRKEVDVTVGNGNTTGTATFSQRGLLKGIEIQAPAFASATLSTITITSPIGANVQTWGSLALAANVEVYKYPVSGATPMTDFALYTAPGDVYTMTATISGDDGQDNIVKTYLDIEESGSI